MGRMLYHSQSVFQLGVLSVCRCFQNNSVVGRIMCVWIGRHVVGRTACDG